VTVKITGKGVLKNMYAVEKSTDLVLIKKGDKHTAEKTVTINTIIPKDGDTFTVEFTYPPRKIPTAKITAKMKK
jgi:hypothetical protein